MSQRRYCAELSRSADEPLAGTAPRVDVWLLLEYAPVWKAKATDDNDLDRATRSWLDALAARYAADGLTSRLQFIRQPRRQRGGVCLMTCRDGALRRLEAPDHAALRQLDPEAGEPLDEPHYFVCTNGQRDVCCARFGLPMFEALEREVGERAWQTTHLGGHRFAPNVLVAPRGLLYGRVEPDRVAAWLTGIEAGRLVSANLRGRSRFPPAVQAAEARLGESGWVLSGADEVTASRWRVRFVRGDETRELEVTARELATLVVPSCGAEPERVSVYDASIVTG